MARRLLSKGVMKTLWKKIEDALTAVAFAEEGEADTARRILSDSGTGDGRRRTGREPTRQRGRAARRVKGSVA